MRHASSPGATSRCCAARAMSCCPRLLRGDAAPLYGEMFQIGRDGEAAHELAGRTYELTEYLVDVLGVTTSGRSSRRRSRSTMPATACAGSQSKAARALLAHVEGRADARCRAPMSAAASAGYSRSSCRISEAMLHRKIGIESTEAEVVVTCDARCMTQITGGLSRQGAAARACILPRCWENATGDGGSSMTVSDLTFYRSHRCRARRS